ncbi:alpha/beta hydrolase [Nocardia terpenica]|uniref:Alpha/beta hydrolase n=1 Tax=Nocardia terpenica TaxID=455432 RepID=A0A6G9Z0F6_9NOCA|nr:alpha/beta hydrolase [Nocardia terpenica]
MRRTIVTVCALTGTTELLSRRRGADYVLPKAWVPRFAGLAGIDDALLSAQLHDIRSFRDQPWTTYWNRLAREQRTEAAPTLSPAAELLIARRTIATHELYAVDALVKSIVYGLISAWPGGSPGRTAAYRNSRRQLEVLLTTLGPALGVEFEPFTVEDGGEIVRGHLLLPTGGGPCPVVLTVNGVDATVQESLLAFLGYPCRGLALAAMEMPGTWESHTRLSAASAQVFDAALRQLAGHPRIDLNRMAMLGLSLGGYWAAAVATTNRLLRCAVVSGAPTDRSFGPAAMLGVPEVVVEAMRNALGARTIRDLGTQLRRFSLRGLYRLITIPLLVVNGDADEVVSVRDSRDLAAAAPRAQLRLYLGDGHCAVGNFADWTAAAERWMWRNFTDDGDPTAAR